MHSRPSVINYGGASSKVVVFYGANDGTFRAVNGNKTGNIGTVPPGGELWSFIPTEFFPKLSRLNVNLPLLKLPTTPAGIVPTPKPKDYFFDGITGVYQAMTSGATTTAYIFLSARRGGRLLYALDVSDPAAPKFLWKRRLPQSRRQRRLRHRLRRARADLVAAQGRLRQRLDQSGPDLRRRLRRERGQRAAGYAGVGHPAMGRGIFVLDAVTGCIVWQAGPVPATGGLCAGGATSVQAGMTYAIPADITLVNRDFDKNGKIDRLYAADIGGNIWRVDLEPTAGKTPSPLAGHQAGRARRNRHDQAQVPLPARRGDDQGLRPRPGRHRRSRASALRQRLGEHRQPLLRAQGHQDGHGRAGAHDRRRQHGQQLDDRADDAVQRVGRAATTARCAATTSRCPTRARRSSTAPRPSAATRTSGPTSRRRPAAWSAPTSAPRAATRSTTSPGRGRRPSSTAADCRPRRPPAW